MRASLLLVSLVLLLAGCPEKKRAAPAESQPVGENPSPVVKPVQDKVEDSLKRGEERANPDLGE
jgi:hypothetical protein